MLIRNSEFNIGKADNSKLNIAVGFNSTFLLWQASLRAERNTQYSTFYFPIRVTACAERYCGGEPLIQLLLDDVVKERCREWIEEISNFQ